MAGVPRLRTPLAAEVDTLQAIWHSSYAHDDPGGFARGGWSVSAWSTETRVLVVDQQPVGLAAIRSEAAADGAMPGRMALELEARQPVLADLLVRAVVDLVVEAGGQIARLFVPERAGWAVAAAEANAFRPVRTIAHMLLPAEVPTPARRALAGLEVRPIRDGEDSLVLDALNRAWAGTWNFASISPAMLAEDLRGQREGMLLAIDADGRIGATCHAVYAPDDQNPDGSPRAWISNVTVDPGLRGRGVARAMLATGIDHLRARGARSISLGVDADDPAPYGLYRSVGFQVVTRMQAWDRLLSRPM